MPDLAISKQDFYIRFADPEDAAALSAFRLSFRETFTHYDAEALEAFLDANYSPARFEEHLRNPDKQCLVVVHEGVIVAYAMFGVLLLPVAPSAPACELYRLYVWKSYQGFGLASLLMERMMAWAIQQGAQELYLGVWEHNQKAQTIYKRYGFVKCGEYDYPPVGAIIDREWIMVKALNIK